MAGDNLQNIYALDPGYDPAYAAQLQRQKLYADALLKQGMGDQLQGQMVGNRYVAPSWTQQLAKGFQTYLGMSEGMDADTKLARLQAEAMRGLFNDGPGQARVGQSILGASAQANPNTTDENGQTINNGGVGPTVQNQQLLDTAMASRTNPTNWAGTGMDKRNAMLSLMLGGNLGDAIIKANAPTPEMRNSQYSGQTPQQFGAAYQAEQRVKGTQALSSNGNILPNGRMVIGASEGQIPMQDAAGNWHSMPIAGYNENMANRAGAVAGATKYAEEPYQPPAPYPTSGGTYAMTPVQANQWAKAGGNAPPNPNVAGQFQGDPRQIIANINAIQDPNERAAAMAAYSNQSNGLNPQWAATPPGAKLQTPGEAKVLESQGEAATNAAKVEANAQALLASIREAKSLVNDLPSGPWGIAEGRAALSNMPGIGNDKMASAVNRWHQIMGQLTMNGIAASGLGRMDIPIVNAIKESSNVPLEASPAAKLAKLEQLEKAIRDHVSAVKNAVPGLNQPGITTNVNTAPMVTGTQSTGMPSMADIQAEIARRQGRR